MARQCVADDARANAYMRMGQVDEMRSAAKANAYLRMGWRLLGVFETPMGITYVLGWLREAGTPVQYGA